MKTNEATLIKKGAAELHIRLSRCKDRPALVGVDAAEAKATADVLLLLLLLLLLAAVVPVDSGAVVMSAPVVVLSVKAKTDGVTEPVIERDVGIAIDGSGMKPRDVDDDALPESGDEIRVMAKAGLVSPESPNTKIQTHMSLCPKG